MIPLQKSSVCPYDTLGTWSESGPKADRNRTESGPSFEGFFHSTNYRTDNHIERPSLSLGVTTQVWFSQI
jgi:hypothetical protein